MNDARFEDATYADRPLKLRAESAEDLAVISSLLQDAVGRTADIHWMPKKRRLVMLVNRFRWENHIGDPESARACERVRTAVTLDSALSVRARGLDPRASGEVFELLALLFEPGDAPAGSLTMPMAGDAELAVSVECLDIWMADMSHPWAARAQRPPAHGD